MQKCIKLFFCFLVFISLPLSVSAERARSSKLPDAKCKEFAGSVFKPCVCAAAVPKDIKYRPSVRECGGRAAAVLSGPYTSSYSVVLRDSQNRDRWPAFGYHGCSAREVAAGLNKCSAFKCQKVIKTSTSSIENVPQQICCFGEAASSPLLAGATRLTIKLRDDPSSGNDPLVRVCLNKFSSRSPLN